MKTKFTDTSFSLVLSCHYFVRILILLSTSKKSYKNLDFYYFVTSVEFLSMNTNVNVTSKSNKQKDLKIFFVLTSSQPRTKKVSGTDPRIRTKKVRDPQHCQKVG